MPMRTLKNQILLMATVSLAIALTDVAQAADSPSKPNFLFILIDDLGWPDLGCYGGDF